MAKKNKTAFFCKQCGFESPKWLGKCAGCQAWNTFIEKTIELNSDNTHLELWKSNTYSSAESIATPIHSISNQSHTRIDLKDKEFNRVLGGGLVLGSITLLGGEPGIGKSTLILQTALKLFKKQILYISGEESPEQIKLRANRLQSHNQNSYILSETQIERIFKEIKKLSPQIVIIDSIQTLYSKLLEQSLGSISQIKTCTTILQRFAKESCTSVIIIGHINKDGDIAGPKILEHIVDTVLQFEGDKNYNYRILRSKKNRFGTTSEIGLYEMDSKGLQIVTDPSLILTQQRENHLSGVSIASSIEGLRPFMVETQALVATTTYATAQRTCTGFENRRLHMLLAVLEKRCGFQLSNKDVFLNIAGGLKVTDPAIDLAVIAAIISSHQDIYIDSNWCFSGEIGLSGEIRPIPKIEQRIDQAEKLGYKKMFISKYNSLKSKEKRSIHLVKVDSISHLLSFLT